MDKRTIVILGVFAVLLVAVLATRGDRASVGGRDLELPRVEKDKVTAIEVSGAREVRLEKATEGWRVVDPARPDRKFAADEAQVASVLTALAELRTSDFVTDRPEAQAEYELDDAKGLTLKVMQNGPPIVLVVGKTSRSGGFYVRKAGSREVFAAHGGLETMMRKDVKDWRQHAMLSIKPEDIAQLTLRTKEGEVLTLEAGTSPGAWSLEEGTKIPAGFRFDPVRADQLVRQVASLRALDFLEGEASADSATGLGEVHDTVEVKLKDGKRHVIHVAPAHEGMAEEAARMDGDARVFLIASHSAHTLRTSLEQLRDLRVLDFDPSQVTRLLLKAGSTLVQVSREGGQWSVNEPKALPAGFEFDPAQVDALLAWLGSLRATRVLDGKATDAQMGVSTPAVLVEVSLQDAPPRTLRLGREAPANATGTKEVQARSSLDALAYALPEQVKTRLTQGLQLFKKPEPSPDGSQQMRGPEQLPPEAPQQSGSHLGARQSQ